MREERRCDDMGEMVMREERRCDDMGEMEEREDVMTWERWRREKM